MFVWVKIKALKYCSVSQYAAHVLPGLRVRDYCLGSGLRERPLIQTVQGLWHLTIHVSQLCTVEKCKNATKKKTIKIIIKKQNKIKM